jgi:hypothetical protein
MLIAFNKKTLYIGLVHQKQTIIKSNREDFFWPCYYQQIKVGKTCQKFMSQLTYRKQVN